MNDELFPVPATEVKETPIVEEPKIPSVRKPQNKDRCRAVVKVNVSDEEYIVRMRPSGLYVRRPKKRIVDNKSLSEVIDFVIGQQRLDFNAPGPVVEAKVNQELFEIAQEVVVASQLYWNDQKKYLVRYRMAYDAMRDYLRTHSKT